MQVDYIRRDTPEEISENGGAYIQLVNKETVGLKSSIDEAKSTLFVVGQDSMIEGYFVGLMRSVFEGLKADGHPRTVGDITFYPVCGGTFDLEKGWDPLVNDVRIYARLLNGLTLDITDWTFRDVTAGRVSYSIDTVSDGETAGIISTDKNVELNGRNFPAKDLLTVSWVCGEKSGTVDSAKFTANVARITIDKTAFSSLASTDNGKEIVFTVKGCYNKATKSAVVKYVSTDPVVTFAHGESSTTPGELKQNDCPVFEGRNLQIEDEGEISFAGTYQGESVTRIAQVSALVDNTPTKVRVDYGHVPGWDFDIGTTVTATIKGVTVTFNYIAA